MNAILGDTDKLAAVAASEGEVALANGDTVRSKAQFRLAGDLFRNAAENAIDSMERNEKRFLAATQYFYAGEYRTAFEICERIQHTLLSANSQRLFGRFSKDVRERSKSDYVEGIRAKLGRLHLNNDDAGVLELLKAHPYVLPRGYLAFGRAMCCEDLGDYRTAALFYSDAIAFGELPLNLYFFVAGAASAISERNIDGAWEFVTHLLEIIPHPLVFFAASLVCYHKANRSTENEAAQLFERQLELFEDAIRQSTEASPETLKGADVSFLISLAYQAAALTFARFGKSNRARELAELAVSLSPGNSDAMALRDLIFSQGELSGPVIDAAIQNQHRRFEDLLSNDRNLFPTSA